VYVHLSNESIITFFGWEKGFMSPYCGTAGQVLPLRLNGLPLGYCDAQATGLHIRLDTQPVKDNLHNRANVTSVIIYFE
jgi:hypothetical protein